MTTSGDTNFSVEKGFRVVRIVLFLLVLGNALCAGLHTVADYDMGWHLATGRWVVQHHQIPHTDVLSFTSAGKPWNYPPFAGVLLYLIYQGFGYAGLSWFCALSGLAAVAYLARRGDIGGCMLAMFATQPIVTRTTPRADLFSTVFFVFFLGELWTFQRGKHTRLWLLPLLMLFWVNLHPGFVAGIGIIVAYLLVELTELPFEERRASALRRLRKIGPWLAASVATTLVNPWGYKVYANSLSLAGLTAVEGKLNGNNYILEFRGLPISTHLLYQLVNVRNIDSGFTWLLLIAFLTVGLFLWRRQVGAAAVMGVAIYAVLAHMRYIGMFSIVVATLGSALFCELFALNSTPAEKRASGPLLLRVPGELAALLGLVLCALTMLHIADYVSSRTYLVSGAQMRFGAGQSSWFPTRAAEFIRREKLPGNIFENYDVGGYAAWTLGPEYPDFLDGRGVDPEIVAEQDALSTATPDSFLWETEADRWHLNVLLLSSPLDNAFNFNPAQFCQSSRWRPVYMDEVSLVFLRNAPENRPWLDRLGIDCATQPLTPPAMASRPVLYDFYLNSGMLLHTLDRDDEAGASLRRAVGLESDAPSAHVELATMLEGWRRLPEAEMEYRKAVALDDSDDSWYALGGLYAREGRSSEAAEAVARAAARALYPVNMYMDLGRLQIMLNHPKEALAAYGAAERNSQYRNGSEALAPELYAGIAEGRSEAQQLLGHWNEAVAYQQEATRRTPRVMSRWGRLATLYEATGQLQLATEARQHAAGLQALDAPR